MDNPPITLFIPQYLQQPQLMSQVLELVEAGRVVLGDNTNAEYVLRSDYQQDVQIHQTITSSNADNYIYLENRLMFLRHVDAYASKFHPYIKQVLSGVECYGITPTKYFVPQNASDVTANIEAGKTYIITHSVTSQRVETADVLGAFTESMYQTNIQNSNYISMGPSCGVWVVEELVPPQNMIDIRGIACRPKDLGTTSSLLGVMVEYDHALNVSDAAQRAIQLFIQHTFYYYGAHFELSVNLYDDRITINNIRSFIDLDNPRIEQVYCN